MNKKYLTEEKISLFDFAHTLFLALGIIVLFVCGCVGNKKPNLEPGLIVAKPQYIEHVVKYHGETLSLIAKWYTGDMNNWRHILPENPGLRPESIGIGDIILIPQDLVVESRPLPKELVRRIYQRSPASAAEKTPEVKAEAEREAESQVKAGKPEALPILTAPSDVERGADEEAPAALRGTNKPETTLAVEPASDEKTADEPVAAIEAKPALGSTAGTEKLNKDDDEREKLLDELLNE